MQVSHKTSDLSAHSRLLFVVGAVGAASGLVVPWSHFFLPCGGVWEMGMPTEPVVICLSPSGGIPLPINPSPPQPPLLHTTHRSHVGVMHDWAWVRGLRPLSDMVMEGGVREKNVDLSVHFHIFVFQVLYVIFFLTDAAVGHASCFSICSMILLDVEDKTVEVSGPSLCMILNMKMILIML